MGTIEVYRFLDANFGMKSLYEKRLKISRVEDLNDPYEGLALSSHDKIVRSNVESSRANSPGCLCFSRQWSNPIMWAHYSDKHRGLCLGFKIPEILAHSVTYVPGVTLLAMDDSQEETRKKVVGSSLKKYDGWYYESEVRINRRLTGHRLCFADFDENLRLFTVIAGVNCSIHKREIARAVSDPAIRILKAALAHDRFQIIERADGFGEEAE